MNNLKRYEEITGKKFVGNDYSIEKFQDSKAVSNLIKEIEKLEHYKHLYSEVKKQKDDVVELINYYGITPEQNDNTILRHILKDILRMLGEIDD
jgi:hypothetical protein